MKKVTLSILATVITICCYAQIYIGKTCEISFYSKGPIEDIYAITKSTKPLLNTTNNDVAFKVTIKGFEFNSALMQEHFNEKYMESDKYPYATFTGKINEKIEYKKEGAYNINVAGKLNMHGVEKERTIPGTITIKGGEILFESKFSVALKDHNVTVPSLVSQNIAETVDVTVKGVLIEFKK